MLEVQLHVTNDIMPEINIVSICELLKYERKLDSIVSFKNF